MAKLGRVTVIVITSFIFFILLSATLLLSTPFMISWGGEPSWYIKVIMFLQNTPFNLINKNGDITLSFVFINALFWTLCLGMLFWIIFVKLYKVETRQ